MKWYILETTERGTMVFQAHAMNISDGWVQFRLVEMVDVEAHDFYIPSTGVVSILEDATGEMVEEFKEKIAEMKRVYST